MTSVPIREWRLHLGVQKTATTHLQDILTLERDSLARQGIDYIPLPIIRINRIPDLRRRNWRAWIGGALLRAEVARKLAPHRTGAAVMVMSEEDWVGPSQDGLEPTPYPQAARRVRALANLSHGADLKLFVAIRSWEAFLPAAYATVLRFLPYPGGFESVRARVVNRPPDWEDFVARVAGAAPRADLRLWRYESYRAHSGEIISALCGAKLDQLPVVADPVRTRTPSAEAIAQAEALDPALPPGKRRGRVKRLFDEDQGEKFSPFSDAEQALLREAYDEQIARIERRWPGIFLF